MNESSRMPVVLLIEDDEVDLEAFRRAIAKRALPYDVIARSSARVALDMLAGQELTAEQKENLVVFLDINMPGMNGHQFLEELRSHQQLRRTIVFILTTSDHQRDKALAYDKNVAGYFVKSKLDGVLDTLEQYLENVEFPPIEN